MKSGNNVLEKLKTTLLSNLVKQHNFPSTIQLWTRSMYAKAAKIFSAQLTNRANTLSKNNQYADNYISASTLERIFKYGYQLPNPIDKRRLNTLNKLALCVGYESFSEYSFSIKNELDIDFKQFILKANAAEFEMYKNLPNSNFNSLLPYFIIDGPAYNQIYKLVNKQIRRAVSLKDNKNPSYFEVLEVEILKMEEETVRIKTKECWYLKWHSSKEDMEVKYYNNNNTQLYLLNKTNEGWKIRVNHYPYEPDN